MPTIQDAVEWHVMVDIETLSVSPNAFITSISAQKFTIPHSPDTELPSRVWTFDPWREQVGSTIDASTIVWRQRQGEESKADLRGDPDTYHNLETALNELREFIGDVDGVWANSPDFDITILNSAARRLGQTPIAPFWKSRDVRTAKASLESMLGVKIKVDNDHTPLQDCRNQINKVVLPLYERIYEYRTAGGSESEG